MNLTDARCNKEYLVKNYSKKLLYLKSYGIIINSSLYFINKSNFLDYYIVKVDNKLLAIPYHISKEIEIDD